MRTSHTAIRRMIRNEKNKLTDEQVFASARYAAYLTDIAEGITKRYKRNSRVITFWDTSENAPVADTNNRIINLNCGNRLSMSFPTKSLKADSLLGIIGHECGHILCRHVLYHSIAQYILKGADALGILGNLTIPIQYAILYWYRKSELSCDRCASIITSPDTVTRTMARLAGGPKDLTQNINMEEWARQADKYEDIRTDGLWNKILQVSATMGLSHPFHAVRVREILKWKNSRQYNAIANNIDRMHSGKTCPACHNEVCDDWKYCKYCGKKL